MDAINFLRRVWGAYGKKGDYFFLCFKRSNGQWEDEFIQFPVTAVKLDRILNKYDDKEWHTYFCPTPFYEPVRKSRKVRGSLWAYSDLDEADPRTINPRPTVAWETSPGRYAALWQLQKFSDADDFETLNRRVTYSIDNADRSGWDLTQVLRLPGTRNIKYKRKPKVKTLWFKDNAFTDEMLPQMGTRDADAIYKKHRIPLATKKLLREKDVRKGKRSEVIWKITNELVEAGLSEQDIFVLIKSSGWNKFAGRRDEDKQLLREITKAGSNRLGKRRNNRRSKLNGMDSHDTTDSDVHTDVDLNDDDEEPFARPLSSYSGKDVDWFWKPYFAYGMFQIVEGDGATNKSFLMSEIISRASRGQKLPGQSNPKPINSCFLLGEDPINERVFPTIKNFKGNLNKVFVREDPAFFDDEDDLERIERFIVKNKIKLLVLDPLFSFFGHVNTNSSGEVRPVLHGIAKLASRTQCCIIGVRHFSKTVKDDAQSQGLGSIEITNAARVVLQVGVDPKDTETSVMVVAKINIGPKGPGQGFRVKHGVGGTKFQWTGQVYTSATQSVKAARERKNADPNEVASEFLKASVGEHGMDYAELKIQAEAKGIPLPVLFNVRRLMGYKLRKGVIVPV